MDKFVIQGGNKLKGEITISGAKNSLLALMPATILAPGEFTLDNTPDLRDVNTMKQLMEIMGIGVLREGKRLTIESSQINKFEAPYDQVKKMRASIYVLGPLLARYGQARVSLPGGCSWGPRPVNFHIEGMKKLGADITIEHGYIIAKAKKLKGTHISFDTPSVGATGNIMMAAVLADGTTLIENAAMEPEINQLAQFLKKMGAKIYGIGTKRIEIEGVEELKPANISTIPDRIEAGTFLVAGAITGGTLTVKNCIPDHLRAVLSKLEQAGCTVTIERSSITLKSPDTPLAVNVTTDVYPGFPTDMQAQWTALMCRAKGTSIVTDSIFVDRFRHIPELNRLGANIEVEENVAIVRGNGTLKGAKVMSTDLRASASLILAGLIAEGETEVLRVYHIDRGYESIEKKLQKLGAQIERVRTDEF
jgi:UDP-N-acetylglucosamine 1-carboxyvinyltransferase